MKSFWGSRSSIAEAGQLLLRSGEPASVQGRGASGRGRRLPACWVNGQDKRKTQHRVPESI